MEHAVTIPDVLKVDEGLYLLCPDDTPSSVARRLYGDVHKVSVLLTANPENWDDLDRIVVPNKKGRVTSLHANESPHDVIRRMFPEQPYSIYLQPYFIWNGGEFAYLGEGDVVFVPER
jgi:hypothetical protein